MEKNKLDSELGYDDDRRPSRVGGALRGSTVEDDLSVMSVGKQMELEANNAIKYRTCSWQKVSSYYCAKIRTN
jgi:hypothetical protein